VLENVIWGKGVAENVRIQSYGGEGAKITQKAIIRYLNVS